ncbi:MAG TPA: sugar ABC transporter permease [Verrucomicrobiales bacterium]|nr:sugar ABC transporter permease [Verrucomicrobiales bacterium]
MPLKTARLAFVPIMAVLSLLPAAWVVSTSLKTPGTEFLKPVSWLPRPASLESYRTVLGPEFAFDRAILNSLIVAITVTALTLLLGGLSAFAISRLRFRHGVRSLRLILFAGLVPPVAVIAPTFVLVRALGLLGTLPGIILPHLAYSIPISTWLLTVYFAGLPRDLDDAARLDGYTPPQIFWRILLPLVRPAMFATGALAFLGSWGEFMAAFTLSLGRPEAQTVPVAILGMSQAFQLQWTWVAAGVGLSFLPVVGVTLIAHRWIVDGLTVGALEEQ